MRSQEPPNAVQIEPVEGCNLFCNFCGLQGIRERAGGPYKFMEDRTMGALLEQMKKLGWSSRIEFAMHGEPTMHPDLPSLVLMTRRQLPRASVMVTSNGGGLLADPLVKLTALFDAGLNVFAFDEYEYVKIGQKLRAALKAKAPPFALLEYPADPDASPHTRRNVNARDFVFVQDISKAVKGTHSSLNNHCGSGAPGLKEPIRARCAKPFRELAVRWDGSIALCCNDWRGEFKCGNILRTPLGEIWDGPRFDSARKFLYQGDRAGLRPCNVCDAKSYRVGLLPDKLGKEQMPAPSAKDKEVVKQAVSGKTLTLPVLRPWETT